MTLGEYASNMSQCIRCSNCKFIPALQIKSQQFSQICPSIDRFNFHAYSGGGRIIIANALHQGRLEVTEELRDIVYKCTMCGGCDISCKFFFGLEPLEILEELRAHCVESGVGPMPQHKQFMQSVTTHNNPYGEPHEQRFAWKPRKIKVKPSSDTAYFAGCTASYRRQEIAKATVKILDKIDYDFTLLDSDEYCCGSPILRVGARKQALELMKANVERLKKRGIKRLVTSCAGCYNMFKVEYPRFLQTDFEVVHTSELLDSMLQKGELTLPTKVPLKVTYHDPCHLGRGSEPYTPWEGSMVEVVTLVHIPIPPKVIRRGTHGVYDPPRRVLQHIPGIELVEMERIREYTYCCGAGGGVKSAFPDFALWTGNRRLEEAEATGAEAIVSCCPFCSTNLQDAIQEQGSKLKFYDLTELVLKSLGGDH